jgi:glycosidase
MGTVYLQQGLVPPCDKARSTLEWAGRALPEEEMMTFRSQAAAGRRPDRLTQIVFPTRQSYLPSPADWRDEVLYFLLVDRFSDGNEASRTLLDRSNVATARPNQPNGQPWRWDQWAQSGAERFQGGTLNGVRSQLGYLSGLGVTALWLSPVMRQRGHANTFGSDTYHGYGVADFLEVDPRFGTRQDLIDLVDAAHQAGIKIIMDVIFNHTGQNWNYPGNVEKEGFRGWPDHYDFGNWLGAAGEPIPAITSTDEGTWPVEFQDPTRYTRAGSGDLGSGALDDPHAENKRSDFDRLRDMATDVDPTLTKLIEVYKYWIALTDCDGFRIDTFKHVALDEARNFCGAIKEYALSLGKDDFFLVAEAPGDEAELFTLNGLQRNLNAVLDIGGARPALEAVGKGFASQDAYFNLFNPLDSLGSHRNLGDQHVSILNDHDQLSGIKLRFTSDLAFDHQVVAPVAIQLFTLGIPMIYYGTEQALASPETSVRQFLPDFPGQVKDPSDRYLREAMFGPEHPRRSGAAGLPPSTPDPNLPGFGPFGTAGHHCFDPDHPAYRRIAALATARRQFPVLRQGRQYPRPIDASGTFTFPAPGDLICWSRILDVEEALIVVNGHGTQATGTRRVLIDPNLNGASATMTVVANTAQAANQPAFTGPHPMGSSVQVGKMGDGTTFVTIQSIGPSEVLILINRPNPEVGAILP